ncbi:vesicle-associated membrane protein 5-like [Dryobates pubescens]|uniref:vesicle-associated membrane protein 5-like n=1 Tax=Dryobates pubescens TaxID=118200 RepID=UPI0023B9DDC4|nr:vesicle-associated membrane protein 5-like [Dryobates pubescens]
MPPGKGHAAAGHGTSRRGWPLGPGAGPDGSRGDGDRRSGSGAHRGPIPGTRRAPTPSTMAGLAQCQRQAEEVTELMQKNLARALEREGRLAELDDRAQELRAMGQSFTRSTRALARQQRRAHRRWRLVAFGLAAVLLLILLLVLVLALGLSRPAPAPGTATPATTPGGH